MKKWDKILIVIYVLLSFASFALLGFYKLQLNNYQKRYIEITVDGKLYKKISFDDNVNQTIPINTKYGKDILKVSNGKAEMVYAECPDKLCIHEGSISKTGESIICLPFRIVVQIKGEKSNEIDEVAY